MWFANLTPSHIILTMIAVVIAALYGFELLVYSGAEQRRALRIVLLDVMGYLVLMRMI